ncbi:hypothetical protein GCM10014713_55560 [Streptomyces purpureus]|uniref:Uncharacterized protein n=1 Tax=Streptomyces purpureus TaxID=1951 RepID=A0A918LV67_9ACTN|nr:hypothetical protein GCM10014713_55560 [Streptomyces purpureus]
MYVPHGAFTPSGRTTGRLVPSAYEVQRKPLSAQPARKPDSPAPLDCSTVVFGSGVCSDGMVSVPGGTSAAKAWPEVSGASPAVMPTTVAAATALRTNAWRLKVSFSPKTDRRRGRRTPAPPA